MTDDAHRAGNPAQAARDAGEPPAQETPYADKTFRDPNPIKRFFQERRLRDALRLADGRAEPRLIVDFGAGDGELCRRLRQRHPRAEIVCYEPHPGLMNQARAKLGNGARFLSRADDLDGLRADLVFCLEVFEHLPPAELAAALDRVQALLASDGRGVVGVPVETGLPALYKGVFRMARRRGSFDARAKHVWAAVRGRPPGQRPSVELVPGSFYHLHHLGFDHRGFERALASRFRIEARRPGPLPWLGDWINAELTLRLAPAQSA